MDIGAMSKEMFIDSVTLMIGCNALVMSCFMSNVNILQDTSLMMWDCS